MEEQFRQWLINRGNHGAANNYTSAIHRISEHYSQQTNQAIDIYSITDQTLVSQIASDYRQTGRFSEFGYEGRARFRNAIARYSEFFIQYTSDGLERALEETTQEDTASNTNFAYEKDLQTSLCAQVAELFPEYRIFGGTQGIEYPISNRRIDVLLEHLTNSSLVVVELKSGEADYQVFGQISMYVGLLEEQYPDRVITGIIIAGSISSGLKSACAITNRISLKTYRMSIELEDV